VGLLDRKGMQTVGALGLFLPESGRRGAARKGRRIPSHDGRNPPEPSPTESVGQAELGSPINSLSKVLELTEGIRW
jgi:hypothetical protein